MNSAKESSAAPVLAARCSEKRVILSMGGKGGVGKTSFMTAAARTGECGAEPWHDAWRHRAADK
jgi:hypothetical protein